MKAILPMTWVYYKDFVDDTGGENLFLKFT